MRIVMRCEDIMSDILPHLSDSGPGSSCARRRGRLHPDLSGVDDLPADNGCDYFSRQSPSIEGGVSRFGMGLGGFESPLFLGIKNRDVSDGTAGQRTSAAQIEAARWTGGKQFHDAGQRDPLFTMQP